MVGERRRYCALLVVPSFSVLEAWANDAGIRWSDRAELLSDPKVVTHVERELFGMLTDFATYEQPKKVALLSEEFSIDNGMLTPTLKVKRRVVRERLQSVIDGLYAEEAADVTAN